MNDYRQLILIEFINRYENSSYYKGKSDGPRKISIVLHKRFPEYGQSFFYEITEELENISFQLKEEGIVTFSKKSIPGNREIILNQEESSIKKIYQELKRVSIKEKIMNYLHQLDEYHVEGFVKDFIDEMKKKISSILGKEYVSIKVAEHSLFKNPGTSIYVKTKLSSRYSEANAGSGEVAVIQLVKKIEEAQEYSLILLDEPEVSIHPGAQEKLKEYLLEVTKRKKLQVVISSHSPILIRDMPSEAIKLYITNSQGRFEVKENVDYREAFYDLEDCVSDKKIIFCEDFAAKNIVEQVLKRMDKTQYFDVEFNPGGEKTLLTKYLPTFVTHDFFKERVFLVLDGDMQTDYVYNAEKLTVKQEKDVSYMKECVKKAYGVDIQAYVDGGNGGKREDQEIDAYKEYLKYYTDSVFYLPSKSIPEKILLESQYVKQQYPSIVNEKVDITNDNAKKIFATISEADYGNEEHINDLIQKLAYKWSMEDSSNKKRVEEIVNEIYKK